MFFSFLGGGKHGTQIRVAPNQNLNNPKQPALNHQLAIPMIKWLVSELAPFKILFACCIFVPTWKQRPLKPVKKVPKTKKGQNISKHQPKQGTKFCLDLFSDFCYFLSLVAGKYLWMFFQSPKPTQLEFSFFRWLFRDWIPWDFCWGRNRRFYVAQVI